LKAFNKVGTIKDNFVTFAALAHLKRAATLRLRPCTEFSEKGNIGTGYEASNESTKATTANAPTDKTPQAIAEASH
jgi:hypothetical protein